MYMDDMCLESVVYIKIKFHGDDFGIDLKQTSHFVDCYRNGSLNSLSIIVNSDCYEKCYLKIKNDVKKYNLNLSLHLNLTEGKGISSNNDYLTYNDGYFRCGFVKLLLMSFNKKKYKNQIKKEVKSQMKRYTNLIHCNSINIDSHQHIHMIPIVLESIIESADELNLKINNIRVPVDNIGIVLRTPSVLFKVKLVNMLKLFILKVLYLFDNRKLLSYNHSTFFGLLFTCNMKKEYIDKLLDKYVSNSLKNNKDLEVMFHPGYIDSLDKTLNKKDDNLSRTLMNKNRLIEKNVLIYIKNKKIFN